MKKEIKTALRQRGIAVPEDHLEELEMRWSSLLELQKLTNDAYLDVHDLSLKNIPGGDHIE